MLDDGDADNWHDCGSDPLPGDGDDADDGKEDKFRRSAGFVMHDCRTVPGKQPCRAHRCLIDDTSRDNRSETGVGWRHHSEGIVAHHRAHVWQERPAVQVVQLMHGMHGVKGAWNGGINGIS